VKSEKYIKYSFIIKAFIHLLRLKGLIFIRNIRGQIKKLVVYIKDYTKKRLNKAICEFYNLINIFKIAK